MTIDTKFSPGQFVWTLFKNKARTFQISKVEISISNYKIIKGYTLNIGTEIKPIDLLVLENNCFSSREDLINSLWYEDTNLD
jgi:hypothetical protein